MQGAGFTPITAQPVPHLSSQSFHPLPFRHRQAPGKALQPLSYGSKRAQLHPCTGLPVLHLLASSIASTANRSSAAPEVSAVGAGSVNNGNNQRLESSANDNTQRLDSSANDNNQRPDSGANDNNQHLGSSAGPSTSSSRSKDSLPAPLVRRLSNMQTASDAADALLEAKMPGCATPSERAAHQIILAALDRGNLRLALSVYDSMCQARGRVAMSESMSASAANSPANTTTSSSSSSSPSSSAPAGSAAAAQRPPSFSRGLGGTALDDEEDALFSWPPASIHTTSALVLGLCRQLAIAEALALVNGITGRGLPRHDAISFGKVIASPLAPTQTLTVVPPQEGCMMVADAFSKYEYEVFTGTVVSTKSEALQGERVTFVCSPGPDRGSSTTSSGSGSLKGASQPRRKAQQGLLPSNPPGTKPGEALTATNHRTNTVMELLPPPVSSTQQGVLPSWVLPAAVMLSGGDAASSLIDPSMPLMLAAGAGGLLGSAVLGNSLVLPRLRQLPDQALASEYMRQMLLQQYAQLGTKVEAVLGECGEDIRVLARLWQLQNKMQSVGTMMSASYGARMERVITARSNIEQRLAKKLELLEGYGRVMNMIEIEVEIDTEVPAAEFEGIAEQMQRLDDLEGLQDDWRVQAEARDEVERLLRTL
ncbi:hypothetical protein DUNSADRAFT_16356 [Dunaliella salina]|uniref:Uncharacterized protein n=1 Tax=Dunaliella salina TaxID=3046 RepID=A0ABQ7H127_DUNSA|nr:hypothetical protein DUNSADRAFT_16356 [Dunaliella salina]|eukprot:KAF5840558.1 hypothetical protein DUNSADRAFT_16356 [Dunaliella salina]